MTKVFSLRLRSALSLAFVTGLGPAWAQAPAPAGAPIISASATREEIVFASNRPWKTSRFYAVGRLDLKNGRVAWLPNSDTSPWQYFDSSCAKATLTGLSGIGFERSGEKKPRGDAKVKAKGEDRERLVNGEWFALEVPSDLEKDQVFLTFAGPTGSCEARIDLTYTWAAGKGGVRPLLMLNPKRNLHGEHSVRFDVPELKLGRVGIALDLLGGYWRAQYPNAVAGNATTIHYFPTTMARGEWFMPFHDRLGLQLALEQSAAAFGRMPRQSVLISDYSLGAFYDLVLSSADAWVTRLGFAYRGHLTDDSVTQPTVTPSNKNSAYLLINGGTHLYFGRYYMAGAEFSWAPASRMAGNGVEQGYSEFLGRLGLRLNSSVQFITEVGQRSYRVSGQASETMLIVNGGLRLKL